MQDYYIYNEKNEYFIPSVQAPNICWLTAFCEANHMCNKNVHNINMPSID